MMLTITLLSQIEINASSAESETVTNEVNPSDVKVYKTRFYILAIYSLASAYQTIFWNTWSPIADTGEYDDVVHIFVMELAKDLLECR